MKMRTVGLAFGVLSLTLACAGEPEEPETVEVVVEEVATAPPAARPGARPQQRRGKGGRPAQPPADVPGTIKGINIQEGVVADLLPAAGPGLKPAVVYIHGGGWNVGSRGKDGWLQERLVNEGYTVFTTDYRLAPAHPFPAAIDDVRAAVRFFANNAKKYDVDPERIAVLGPSAGGHLAMMAGLHDGAPVKAVVSLFGPADLTLPEYRDDHDKLWVWLKDADPADASPINLVSRDDPPVLMIIGTNDQTTVPRDNEAMDKALKGAGVSSTLHMYQGAPHGLHNQEAYQERAVTDILAFLTRELGG